MYLTGEEHLSTDWTNPENNQCEGGYRLKSKNFELGYWRKHPDLHGFIVENFSDGEDDCRPIYLDEDDLAQLVLAVREGRLPKTTGFFFGESTNDAEQRAEDIEILTKAIAWLQANDWRRHVYYQASW
ncbi:hypothetical protein ACFQ5Q_13985 [Luteolibacter ambystomatis]